jgi:phosphatidate cytidylyltransferase
VTVVSAESASCAHKPESERGALPLTPELKKRIQTAVLGVGVLILLLIFGGSIGAVIVAAALSIAMLYEFSEITLSLPDRIEKRFVLLGSAFILQTLSFWMPGSHFGLLCVFFLGITAYFLFTAEKYSGEDLKRHYSELMFCVFGFIYLAVLPTFLVSIRSAGYGTHWTLLFLFIVWANDIGAYFTGNKFGKKRLYPHISPKKSWEGAYGGFAASLAVSLVYKAVFFSQLSWFGAVAVPLVLSVVSPVGDLAESFLKRSFDKKDSGSLLPGHGGFLDRFDSVVFALPVMYAMTRFF